MGGGSCTDSNTDEEQAILIPQEALSTTIAADNGLKHTISFETTGDWQASVQSPGSGDTWISISPTSGSAGKNDLTATLTENTKTTSREAVITILCGVESVAVTITQQGIGTSEDPAKPERPEVAPENRLTYIEVSDTETTTTPEGTKENTTKGYASLIYDAQGTLTNFDYYTFDSNQPDKLDGSYKTAFNWDVDNFSTTQYYIEITGYGAIPTMERGSRSTKYRLSKGGLISQCTDSYDNRELFIYNADGTIAAKESYRDGNALPSARSEYKWEEGNLTSITTSQTYNTTYTYTPYLNPWQGIDVGSLAIVGVYDVGQLPGISGLTTRHLPESQQVSNGSISRYEYTFDTQGRVSTIVVNFTLQSTSGNNKIASQTEYKLHYGSQFVTPPDYVAYLTDQKLIEEGTLNYTFDDNDPDGEHTVLPNAFTSYAKILNTLSDGTTKEITEYRQIKITLPEEHLGYIYATQQDIDEFKLISATLEKEDNDKDIISPLWFTCTLTYNCFTERFRFKIDTPFYNLYSGQTGKWISHPMPMPSIDNESIVCYPPEVTKLNDNPIQVDYKFVQKYVLKINPEAETTDQNIAQIDRLLYVRK